MFRYVLRVFACCAAWLVGSSSRAQCDGEWLPGMSVPGTTRTVLCSQVHDDGAGPGLFIGGEFHAAGDTVAHYLARWDGNQFDAVGGGTNGPVYAMTVFDGELIIVGAFSRAGTLSVNGIAAWDGTQWHGVGGGINVSRDPSRQVATLVHDGRLYIGAQSTLTPGGRGPLVSWDGVSWRVESLPPGVPTDIHSLAFFNGDLYLARGGSEVWRRSASTWQSVMNVMQGVDWLGVVENQLYIGGRFVQPTVEGPAAEFVTAFDGSGFHYVATGLGREMPYTYPFIGAITRFQGELLVAGGFNQGAAHIAQRTDDLQWQTLGGGISPNPSVAACVLSLEVFQDTLVALGQFPQAGAQGVMNFAVWDGLEWRGVQGGPVSYRNYDPLSCLTVYDDSLIAAGSFTSINNEPFNRIAAWDGAAWTPLGLGVASGQVFAMTASESDLYVAGAFSDAGGAVVRSIARWDGHAWSDVGGGVSGVVYGLVAEGPGVIAVGNFSEAGGVPTAGVAYWNGGSWASLASSTNNSVARVLRHEGDLIAGGTFTQIDGVAANRVARRRGSSWEAMGPGFNGPVLDLCVYAGNLYAAGQFTASGQTSLQGLARWDGANWQPAHAGLAFWSSLASTLTVFDGCLFVRGNIATAGGRPSPGIARWNGVEWLPVGEGILTDGASQSPMAAFGPHLCLGGTVVAAGDRVTWGFARWSPACCDPDVNCDGALNGFDIAATEEAVNGDFSNFCQSSADLNEDGSENGFDIETEEIRVNGAPC